MPKMRVIWAKKALNSCPKRKKLPNLVTLINVVISFQDESVKKRVAPVYIGIFETSFVLGPAIGLVGSSTHLYIFT